MVQPAEPSTAPTRYARNHCSLALLAAAALALLAGPPARGDDRDGVAFFEKRVRPVLVEKCYACHSAQAGKVRGGRLRSARRAHRL